MNAAIERNAFLESELDEKEQLKSAVQRYVSSKVAFVPKQGYILCNMYGPVGHAAGIKKMNI